MGLVISRRKDQAIRIVLPGVPSIRVTVTEVHRSSCKLHVEAPLGVEVLRAELVDTVELARLALEEDRSVEQQIADGDYPNPYANNEGDE